MNKIQLKMSKEPHIFFLAVQEEPHGSTAKYEMTELCRLPEKRLCRPQVTTFAFRHKQRCLFGHARRNDKFAPVYVVRTRRHAHPCHPVNIFYNASLMTEVNLFGSITVQR